MGTELSTASTSWAGRALLRYGSAGGTSAGSVTRDMHPDRRSSKGQSLTEFALILPILLVLLLGIADFARLYNTMITVEAAAREAADYGTLYPWQWDASAPANNRDTTVAAMRQRACVATSHLPEYAGPDASCTNPSFSYDLDETAAGVSENQCHLVARSATPCNVVVNLEYRFDLLVPTSLLGLPSTFTFERSSTFAISDFEIDQ
jgi:Flp pilus assembly protein TadG